jgi:hypothetical protein
VRMREPARLRRLAGVSLCLGVVALMLTAAGIVGDGLTAWRAALLGFNVMVLAAGWSALVMARGLDT